MRRSKCVTCVKCALLTTLRRCHTTPPQTGDLFINSSAKEVVAKIATDLPTTSSAVWLNWILVRTLIVIPLQYLFQFNAHLFKLFRCNCCMRCSQGGGMGGPLPFRLYVDSSVVLLCALTFTIISPLVLPCTLVYFLVTTPLWRRQLILVYRPMFDAGGMRWPFLFNVVMSALYMSIFLVSLVLLLKNMYTPSIISFLSLIPSIDFHRSCIKRFKLAYSDIGLMQAGLINESNKKRGIMDPGAFDEKLYEEKEDFRKWLVDAHLSAFIPICMLDNQHLVETLTAAPAQTVYSDNMLSGGLDGKWENEGDRGDGDGGKDGSDGFEDRAGCTSESSSIVSTYSDNSDIESQQVDLEKDISRIHHRRQTLKNSIVVEEGDNEKKGKQSKRRSKDKTKKTKVPSLAVDETDDAETPGRAEKHLHIVATKWENEKAKYEMEKGTAQRRVGKRTPTF